MGKNFLVKILSLITIGFPLTLAIPEGKNALIKDQRNHRNWHLINPDNCGLNNEFRIIGGVDAQLGQFPWIVRLGFLNKRNKMIFKCGGSIINSKYVVSAAHCFKTEEKLKLVRVGEHDESTNPDCDDDDNCAPPVADYEVESVTKHPDYDHPTLYSNDIALIRLVGRIEFNEIHFHPDEDLHFRLWYPLSTHIKTRWHVNLAGKSCTTADNGHNVQEHYAAPICFEYGDLLQKEYVGQLGEVAGWGIYDLELEAPSSILQVVRLPIMRRKHCQELLEKKTVITQKQLCAGGVIGKDSCGGDSGGPLMLIDSVEGEPPRYYLIGLVSFGTKRCAKTNLPGVYTRISYFLPWILDNIYP